MYEFTETEHFPLLCDDNPTLFLDIDGVLNSTFSINTPESHSCICQANLTPFQYILDSVPNLQIILSSSWRCHHTLEECKTLVNAYFNLQNVNLIGRTPICSTNQPAPQIINLRDLDKLPKNCIRGREIQYVLKQLQLSRYAILDDFDDFLPHQKHHLVRTNMHEGLTIAQAKQVVEILLNERL